MASSSNTERDVGNSRWYCHICEDETEAVSEVIDWLCSGGDAECSESAVRSVADHRQSCRIGNMDAGIASMPSYAHIYYTQYDKGHS